MESRLNTQSVGLGAGLDKAPTYIDGLDDILEGGLPRGRTTVVSGGVGSGKTLFGLEFLYRGALHGEAGIFVGFEESPQQLRENAATLGWDLESLEKQNRLVLLDGRIKPETVITGGFSLKGLLAVASGTQRERNARRIVIDALEVALRLFDTPQTMRNELHALNTWLQAAGLSAVLTIRQARGGPSVSEEFFESLADCLVRMDARVDAQITPRRLRVIKYRGSDFGRNEYPYTITTGGFRLAPISTVGLRHKPLGEHMTTGISRLDDMLGGGYRRGACILFAGLPGTGKTILVSTFVAQACGRGERVLYIGFEESEAAMVENVRSAGLDLKTHADKGCLSFLVTYPEAMGAEDHYFRAMECIQAFCPAHVVVDAISACERMGGKLASYEYLMRLLNACKERGITVFLINQLSGATGYVEISGNEISSMVDTVLFLHYQPCPGETNRILQVFKSRGSKHSNVKHEFVITDAGIHLLDPYVGEGDVLTGTLRQRQELKDRLEAQRLAFDIQFKELELARLRLAQKEAEQALARRAAAVNRAMSSTPATSLHGAGESQESS
ncbi:circadian clock protein KaiC [Desulfosoma sp.]